MSPHREARPETLLEKLPRTVSVWLGLFILFTGFALGIAPFLLLYRALGGDPAWALAARVSSRGFRGFLVWTLFMGPPRIRGFEGIREKGPFVVVANHESNVDVCMLAAFSPRPTRLVAKVALRKIPIIAGAVHASGCLIAGDEESPLVAECVEAIRSGVSVAFFPEGTRSRGHGVRRFRRGAFDVAAATGAPILPIVIVGSAQFMPAEGIRMLGPYCITVEALAPRRLTGDPEEFRRALRAEIAAAHARILAEPFHERTRREITTVPAASDAAVES